VSEKERERDSLAHARAHTHTHTARDALGFGAFFGGYEATEICKKSVLH
jgi:hypothetical protein